MSMTSPYCVELHPAVEFDSLKRDPEVFAILQYGQTTQIDQEHPGLIQIALPPIAGDELIEVWRSAHALQQAEHGPVRYQYCDQFLFGSLLIENASDKTLAQSSAEAYQQIHDALEHAGFPGLLRMWNYFPRINLEVDGLERYRAFCVGRHQALEAWHFPNEQLPAATAIGTLGEGLLIYFVASKKPGIQIENPRQVSAFHYPEQYGPKSPTFSRATLTDWSHLYLSGTASIVGHETLHAGDSLAQLDETLANLRIVLERAHDNYALNCDSIEQLNLLRLYVRDPSDASNLLEHLQQSLDSSTRVQLLQGDICRSDLLIEIEAMYAPC